MLEARTKAELNAMKEASDKLSWHDKKKWPECPPERIVVYSEATCKQMGWNMPAMAHDARKKVCPDVKGNVWVAMYPRIDGKMGLEARVLCRIVD